MKTLQVFLLVLFFLHSKTGVAFNLHYCGGHLASISWVFSAEGCGMEFPKPQKSEGENFAKAHCCDDSTFIAQDQSPQTQKYSDFEIGFEKSIIFSPEKNFRYNNEEKIFVNNPSSESPPIKQRFKDFCQFIFYG